MAGPSEDDVKPAKTDRTTDAPQPDDVPSSPLARLRLLIALDALLVEGSVKAAAETLGLSSPAMSRMLAQLRSMFGDDLVHRTGRGMVPTPFAEELRNRLRALAAEASDLIQSDRRVLPAQPEMPPRRPLIQNPPLAVNPVAPIDGQPDLAALSRRLGQIGADAEPRRRLASYIAMTGGGIGRPRPLTQTEAEDALRIVLDGQADPIQVGALLVALQYRGINANELAGFASAARRNCMPLNGAAPVADLDWPIYRSPRVTTPPWFIHAARLVASAGYRVLMHGFARGIDRIDDALEAAGIPVALSPREAETILAEQNLAFIPLPSIDPQLQALIALYRLFEMRSPVNMTVQLLNPLGAPCTIIGAPSRTGRMLHCDAAALLDWPRLVAVASNRDVAQATPAKTTPLIVLDRSERRRITLPSTLADTRSDSNPGYTIVEYWHGVWSGAVRDESAVEAIVSTAALALLALSPDLSDSEGCRARALDLWASRQKQEN